MKADSIPVSERIHVGFFGRVNTGKSSLVNYICQQEVSLVSEKEGTTTDPVRKAMELLPLGPVVITDTAGLLDKSDLGELRMAKSKEVLCKMHIAILVTDVIQGITETEHLLLDLFAQYHLPFIVVYNKMDLPGYSPGIPKEYEVYTSAKTGENIDLLKEKIAHTLHHDGEDKPKRIIGDLLSVDDHVVLVVPIDQSAPKGRLILPQQMTIRDCLESGACVTLCKDLQLEKCLKELCKKPRIVITDSQVFEYTSKIVPEDILLTSFSVLFARYKGNLSPLLKGTYTLDELKDGSHVLISEGCTHHRQCGDIGRDKLPAWIKQHCNADINFSFTSGGDFPRDVSKFSLIVHCGGCMLTEKEMHLRINTAGHNKIPVTNYGLAIAHMKGILKRSLEPFQDVM